MSEERPPEFQVLLDGVSMPHRLMNAVYSYGEIQRGGCIHCTTMELRRDRPE